MRTNEIIFMIKKRRKKNLNSVEQFFWLPRKVKRKKITRKKEFKREEIVGG